MRAIHGFEDALQAGAEDIADGICDDLDSLLADPLVQSLMTADRVDVGRLRTTLRKIAAALRGETRTAAVQRG